MMESSQFLACAGTTGIQTPYAESCLQQTVTGSQDVAAAVAARQTMQQQDLTPGTGRARSLIAMQRQTIAQRRIDLMKDSLRRLGWTRQPGTAHRLNVGAKSQAAGYEIREVETNQ